ncbi:MAG TPA: CHRD domain-containing protein [Acidimicrobiia bacterium]|jgi:hypothetical protein|nr:CHRD domain-containing protein [Acidimicrobiia bacterium]
MRRGRLLAIGLLGVGSWLVMPAAHATETTLKAVMDGKQEVPGPGDPDGTGTATIVLDDAKNTACYEFTYKDIGKPTAAHIHTGATGVSGPPAIDFKINTNGDKGCVNVDPTTVKAVRDNPAGHYVNIHTSEFGNGAIRGQLAKG